jgi:hypothetical protein
VSIYGLGRAFARGAGDINVANSGDGTVITDRSDNIASKSSTDLTTSTDRSDNSTVDSHDQTATPTIVEQPEYNDPIVIEQPPVQVIEKDVVIVDQPILPEVEE